MQLEGAFGEHQGFEGHEGTVETGTDSEENRQVHLLDNEKARRYAPEWDLAEEAN